MVNLPTNHLNSHFSYLNNYSHGNEVKRIINNSSRQNFPKHVSKK